MSSGRSNKLTGAVGEFLVAAELCRRNLLATPFAGNVPHYDIIASGQVAGHVLIQVKAMNQSSWQFNVQTYLDVRMHTDGRRQIVGRVKPQPVDDLVCILVALRGDEYEKDRFFILDWKVLRTLIAANYKKYLKSCHYIRRRAPESFHTVVKIEHVTKFEDRWEEITRRVKS